MATQPSPPSPAQTEIVASSMNDSSGFMGLRPQTAESAVADE
jgi:hypothetical protein